MESPLQLKISWRWSALYLQILNCQQTLSLYNYRPILSCYIALKKSCIIIFMYTTKIIIRIYTHAAISINKQICPVKYNFYMSFFYACSMLAMIIQSLTSTMRGVVYSEWRIPMENLGGIGLFIYTFSGLWAPGPGIMLESMKKS